MRVSQIQNLTWGGNVLVLAGLAYVGLHFWDVSKNSARAAKEPVWEKAKGGADDPAKRWPGELKAFEHIWKTPVNGRVPPPPEPPRKDPVKPDKVAALKGKLVYLGGFESPTQPWMSTARIKFETKEMSIAPGISLDDFQLIEFTILEKAGKPGKLVFKHPDTGLPVEIEQVPPQGPSMFDPTVKAFEPFSEQDALHRGPVTENGDLPFKAYRDLKSGDWIIPPEEQFWIEEWGEKKMWPTLNAKPVLDAEGRSHGLRIESPLEAGTHLATSHGINVRDVIRSINGVAVGSKEDILLYLRGPGKGLERYEVEVDTDGAVRKVVYQVPRPRRR